MIECRVFGELAAAVRTESFQTEMTATPLRHPSTLLLDVIRGLLVVRTLWRIDRVFVSIRLPHVTSFALKEATASDVIYSNSFEYELPYWQSILQLKQIQSQKPAFYRLASRGHQFWLQKS